MTDLTDYAAETEQIIAKLRESETYIPGAMIVHNIISGTIVYMSERGCRDLGITFPEILNMPMDEYFSRYFNPEDAAHYVPRILEFLERNEEGESLTFFQQVRTGPGKSWAWYSSVTKVLLRNGDNRPVLTLTVSAPVHKDNEISSKVDRLLHENDFIRSNSLAFSTLTRREKEILRLLASGNKTPEIATQLFISEGTVNTHRKSIRKKLQAKNSAQLADYARAFNLV